MSGQTKYSIIEKFYGYSAKRDVTKINTGTLTSGSINVVSTDRDGVAHRPGYTIDGEEGESVDSGIQSSYTWSSNTKGEIPVRAGDGKFFTRIVDGEDVSWKVVKSDFNSTSFVFDRWYDASEQIDFLLFVNGTSDIHAWSGGKAKVDITGSTSDTLKLEDDGSNWLTERFVSNPAGGEMTYDKKLVIDGTEYTYTGGEGTNTLTGVSPDPTSNGHSDGDWAIQSITTFEDAPGSNSNFFTNDIIVTLYNQVWVASYISNAVHVANQVDFTDFVSTPSASRGLGDAQVLYLDGKVTALKPDDEKMNVSAAGGFWYTIEEQLSGDQSTSVLNIALLKSGAQQSALSQDLTFKAKNSISFTSQGKTFDQLGNVENFTTRQTKPISDPIKTEFETYDFTGGEGYFYKNKLYICLPAESRLLIYDIENGFWEAPWVLPAGSLSQIGGELYMHSNTNLSTYKLYDGQNDAGKEIVAQAVFAYTNNGDRVNKKSFNERFTEGFITTNTVLKRKDQYDWRGSVRSVEVELKGNDDDIIIQSYEANPLGSNPLGEEPLGSTTEEQPEKLRFRAINDITNKDYRELRVIFRSQGIDQYWEVNAYGHNTVQSSQSNFDIKK